MYQSLQDFINQCFTAMENVTCTGDAGRALALITTAPEGALDYEYDDEETRYCGETLLTFACGLPTRQQQELDRRYDDEEMRHEDETLPTCTRTLNTHELIQKLLSCVSVNIPNTDGLYPIHIACNQQPPNLETVRLLATIIAQLHPGDRTQIDCDGNTALYYTVQFDVSMKFDATLALLNAGVDPNVGAIKPIEYCLMLANGFRTPENLQVIGLLAQHGVHPHAPILSDQQSAFGVANKYEYPEALEALGCTSQVNDTAA